MRIPCALSQVVLQQHQPTQRPSRSHGALALDVPLLPVRPVVKSFPDCSYSAWKQAALAGITKVRATCLAVSCMLPCCQVC